MIEACASITTGDASAEQVRNQTVNGNRKHSSEEPQDRFAPKRAKRSKLDPFALSEPTKPASTAPIPPVNDASGLFTIDPNPTAINALLNDFDKVSTSKKGKRRRSQPEPTRPLGEEVYVGGGAPPATKRFKTEHEKVLNSSAEVVEDYERSFEAKVELRLKQKEQDRQKKGIKKRKRGSDVARGSEDGPAVDGDLVGHDLRKQIHTQKHGPGLKEQIDIPTQQNPSTTTGGSKQANTKRPRRAAAEAATDSIEEELAADPKTGTRRWEIETNDLGGNDKYNDNKRKKRKPRSRKPKDAATGQT